MTTDPRAALVAWRLSTGYSQTEVGALFHITGKAVGNWETGRARVPRRVQAQLRAEGWLGRQSPRWTPEQDAWLLDHAGTAPTVTLADGLAAHFGVQRTPMAVQNRLYQYGQSRQVAGRFTRAQIARLCGVSPPTVTTWVRRGWLPLSPDAQAVQRGIWTVTPAALHAFISEYAVHLDPATMPPGVYRNLAAAVWARERWLSPAVVAQHVGVHHATVCGWIHAGLLPAIRRQHHTAPIAYAIRTRDLMAFLKQREAA